MPKDMTSEDVVALLQAACERAGSQIAWAQQNGLSPAYITDVLKGRREPAEAICGALGLERVIVYRRKAK